MKVVRVRRHIWDHALRACIACTMRYAGSPAGSGVVTYTSRDGIVSHDAGGCPGPEKLKAPFPWFGGKSRVADIVWRAFGDVPNYVEPFAGSLAVLLGRPYLPKIETVNDADSMLANFWRAVTADPAAVAKWCDWPVSECDLAARHRWLLERLPDHRERMFQDPDYYDAKIAGWWVWGLSAWIGSGWCSGRISAQVPSTNGKSAGMGVHKIRMPDLWGAGKGMHAPSCLPSLGNSRGVHGASKPPCQEWFRSLQARLRRVRVCCGDWTRVLGDSTLGTTISRNSNMNPCGVFLDPPYSTSMRAADLYAEDDGTISQRVAEWAIERGEEPDLRIVVCGYEGEHEFPANWTKHAWKAHRGYAAASNANVYRERIWFSPHCLPVSLAALRRT